jgi:hypothetical protein
MGKANRRGRGYRSSGRSAYSDRSWRWRSFQNERCHAGICPDLSTSRFSQPHSPGGLAGLAGRQQALSGVQQRLRPLLRQPLLSGLRPIPNLRPDNATVGEFRVLDTRTWRKIGTIKTRMPVWTTVIGNDGKLLYAMAPQKHSILVIDTVKMRQIRILKIGGTPTLAVVAP